MEKHNEMMEPTMEELTVLETELNEEDFCSEEAKKDMDFITEDSYTMYLRDIAKYRQLTCEEELELGAKVQAGGADAPAAREKMINANYKLVVHIAKKYAKACPMELMDIVMAGNEGLLYAVDRFDPSRGYRFSTYAYWWIRQAITRSIAKEGYAIRIPVNSKCERMSVVSLDATVTEESDTTLADMIPDENSVDPCGWCVQQSLKEKVNEALGALTKKETLLMKLRNGMIDGRRYTLDEISKLDEFRVTRERVRQMELKTTEKLRRSRFVRENLFEYIF